MSWVTMAGVRLLGWGVVCGFAISWALTGTIDRLLVGVASTDPLTVAAVAAILVGVGLGATLIPSWRATRVDPIAVLRRG